jgi:predicted DNA-binding transcriptional regulator AlpA
VTTRTYVPFPKLAEHGVPYKRTHLARLIKAGEFPRPYNLSPGRIAWDLADLDAWNASRPQQQAKVAT